MEKKISGSQKLFGNTIGRRGRGGQGVAKGKRKVILQTARQTGMRKKNGNGKPRPAVTETRRINVRNKKGRNEREACKRLG